MSGGTAKSVRLIVPPLVGLTYAAVSLLTMTLAGAATTPTFFPAAGVTAAAFWMAPRRCWAALCVAVFTAEFTVDLIHGFPPAIGIGLATANALEPVATVLVIRALGRDRNDTGVRFIATLAGGAASGCAIAALIGASSLASTGMAAWWEAFAHWWSGDMLGQLVFAPALMSATVLASPSTNDRTEARVLRPVTAVVAVVSVGALTWLSIDTPYAFVVLPLVAWLAVRHGHAAVSFASLATAAPIVAYHSLPTPPALGNTGLHAADTVAGQVFLVVLVVGAHLLAAEVRQKHAVEAALRSQEQAFRDVVDNVQIAIVEVDAVDAVVRLWNPAAERLFGWSSDEVVGHPLPTLPPANVASHAEVRRSTVASPTGLRVEGRRRRRDGSEITVSAWAASYRTSDGAHRIVTVLEDITERQEREELLWQQATHDSLTGLPNRALLHDRVTHALADLARTPGSVAVLACDLNGFKSVNDEHGHQTGDVLLVALAHRLRATLRDVDTLARVGGDEFVVLVRGRHAGRDALVLADRLGGVMSRPFVIDAQVLPIGMSIGIAHTTSAQTGQAALLHAADKAMYTAKRCGDRRPVVADLTEDERRAVTG